MLLYAIAARTSDGSVLVECSAAGMEGNYPSVAQELIKALCAKPDIIPVGNRKTFIHRVQSTGNGATNNATTTQSDYNFEADPLATLWKGLDDVFGYENDSTTEQDSSVLNHYFHLVHGESVFYICLSDDTEGRQQNVNFAFLHEFMSDFTTKFSPNKIKRANAYEMEKSFSSKLISLMHHYNTHRNELQNDTRISQITSEVDSLKSLMGENIKLLLKRGDQLEDMIVQSESLVADSKVFAKRTTELKKVMKYRYFYYKLIIAGFCILLIYFMVATVCGFGLSRCRSDEDEE